MQDHTALQLSKLADLGMPLNLKKLSAMFSSEAIVIFGYSNDKRLFKKTETRKH